MRFRGRTVLVTGASRGLGQACAKKFDSEGAGTILVGRAQNTLAEVSGQLKQPSLIIPADLADRAAVGKIWQAIEAECWKVDVLVNNAGVGA